MSRLTKIIAITAIIYILVLVGVFALLAQFFDVTDITGIGQLFADWLLLPTIIIGFWITIREFHKAQEKAEVRFSCHGDSAIIFKDDSFVVETSKQQEKRYKLHIYLENSGTVMTNWFRLEIQIPRNLTGIQEADKVIRWYLGNEDNWKREENNDQVNYIFSSNGEHALFPGEKIHIGTFKIILLPNRTYPERVEIKQSIVTEKTSMKTEYLKLSIQPEILDERKTADSSS
jgi:hypothetical protein